MRVSVVAVHVDTIGVFAGGAVHVVVAAVVGAVGVGIGTDVEVDVFEDVLHFRLVGVLQQVVDETEHHDPADDLVAVDGGGVEELRFAVGSAIVDVGQHNLTAAGQGAKGDDLALVGMVGLESEHHLFVGAIGGVAVPVVFGSVATVPHGCFFEQRRRGLKRDVIAEFDKTGKVVVVGVCRDHIAINAVDRDGLGDGFEVVVAIQAESEIILIALLHELL